MKVALCGDCGAVLGTCPECGETAECGYCALGVVPPPLPRDNPPTRSLARRRSGGRVYTPPLARKKRERREPEPSLLERTTGLTGDHVAAIAGAAIIGALSRGGAALPARPGRMHVVEGDYREVP